MERIPFGITRELVKGGTGTYDSELSGVYPLTWQKNEGDIVRAGEVLASLEIEKTVLEIPAPCVGRIVSIFGKTEWSANGETITTPYGAVLAPPLGEMEAEVAEEKWSPEMGQRFKKIFDEIVEAVEEHASWEAPYINELIEGSIGNAASPRATPLAKKIAAAEGVDITALHGTGVGGRIDSHDIARALDEKSENAKVLQRAESIRAVPAARALAREKGLELAGMQGTGPEGLILLDDVLKALYERHPDHSGVVEFAEEMNTLHGELWEKDRAADSALSPVSATSAVRKTIARLLARSWKEIVHAGDTLPVDATALMEFIGQYNSVTAPFTGTELRLDYLVAWYARELLKSEKFRAINGYWDAEKEEAVLLDAVNIGFAVDTERGLVIPVVHDSGDIPFAVFVKEAHDIIEKARRGALRVGDMRDLSFTVNNTGVLGGENPASIIPYAIAGDGTERPTGMILSLAKIRRDRKRSVLPVVFRFDHRLFDGREAVAFVRALREYIESKKSPQEFADDLSGKKGE